MTSAVDYLRDQAQAATDKGRGEIEWAKSFLEDALRFLDQGNVCAVHDAIGMMQQAMNHAAEAEGSWKSAQTLAQAMGVAMASERAEA